MTSIKFEALIINPLRQIHLLQIINKVFRIRKQVNT